MAEHPAEVSQITTTAKALAVNLGNISDTRMTSMLRSGKVALEKNIPTIIDIVGVACSSLRLDFATEFINRCQPTVIKGNLSELKALYGMESAALGIDAGEQDALTTANRDAMISMLTSLATRTGAVIVATGAMDIITDGSTTYLIENGCEMLSMITGTGCMLNVLIATFISTNNIMTGAVLGTALMGICGECAQTTTGTATFRTKLLDSFFTLSNDTFTNKLRYSLL